MKTEHTSIPWLISDYPNGFNLEIIADDGRVCTVHGTSGTASETRANAEFICRASNNHEALVSACQIAIATIERLQRHAPGSAIGTLDVLRVAIKATTP